MKLCTIFRPLIFSGVLFCGVPLAAVAAESSPADVIIYHAQVITVNSTFAVDQAVAVRGNEIVAVGKDRHVEQFKGPNTRMIDAHGATVLPGLSDSHVYSYQAAVSELTPPPVIHSIAQAQEYIRTQAAQKPASNWIVVEGVYPSRIKEGRLPNKAELDAVAPKHPVYWDCGDVVMLNSKALEMCRITKDTKVPLEGEIGIDPVTLIPTGLLRRANNLVKLNLPSAPNSTQRRAALKQLYALYNQQGITSIGERRASDDAIKLFRELSAAGELNVRIHCSRYLEPGATLTNAVKLLDALTNTAAGQLAMGPTGAGDDWVRIGALNVQLDGDLRNGTAYLRTPWGIGDTYQIDEPAYRGEIKLDQEMLSKLFLKAAQDGWQVDTDCTGDAALDQLLNCYQRVQFKQDIRERRFVASHATFQAAEDWDRCKQLGIVFDAQPAWLYCDGASLMKTMGEHRLRNFLAFKGFYDHGLIVGGGSGHESGLDAGTAMNPWNPWLGMWITLARQTDDGAEVMPEQKLTREQAIRLYTYNNAYLNFAEAKQGSLEPGKLADLIMIDRDILKCPVDDVRNTKVTLTMVGGRIVWEAQP